MSAMGDAPVLRLQEVTVAFGGLKAVEEMSMAVPRGQRWAVIGPNGAGKTTLFRAISGEITPTSGRIEFLGRDVTGSPPYGMAHRGLGRTYQVTNLFPGLTVRDNVAIAAQGRRPQRFKFWWPAQLGGAVDRAVDDALSQVGLGRHRHRRVDELSHGEQRQLELALALATTPQLLLLDEPAAGLSTSERRTMREVVENLPQDLTLLLIEHDMDLALELVQHVVVLHLGSLLREGTPDEIRADDRVQAVYLGSD